MILALDPGHRTGWAASNGTCGTLDLRPEWQRDWAEAGRAFTEWLAPRLTGVILLVVERPFGRPGTTDVPNAFALLAHMQALKHGIRRMEMAPSRVKMLVAHRGNASKLEVQRIVEACGYTPSNDHEADACALLEATLRQAVREHGPNRA